MNKYLLLKYVLVIIFLLLVMPYTYSKFTGKELLTSNSSTGEIVYDVNLIQNDNYIENGISYFYIDIKNYKVINNITDINYVPSKYIINVYNDKTNGIFSTTYNGIYSDKLIITDELKTKLHEDKIKVYVKSKTNEENVNYRVSISVEQNKVE